MGEEGSFGKCVTAVLEFQIGNCENLKQYLSFWIKIENNKAEIKKIYTKIWNLKTEKYFVFVYKIN